MAEKIVIGHQLTDVTFKTPSSTVDKETGEIYISYSDESSGKQINKVNFLYYITFDDDGNCISYEPVTPVNNFLIDLKINHDIKDTNHISNGLIHYFSKLIEWGLEWDEFPYRESSRPTYKFRKYLTDAVKSVDSELKLQGSTAKNYMSAVRRLYSYYLTKNYKFANPPMQHELIDIFIEADGTSMNPFRKIAVSSSDLRLKVPSSSKKDRERPLKGLNDDEWNYVNEILKSKRKIIKNKGCGVYKEESLPIEYSYMCMVMRWAGVRREEAVTLRKSHIKQPTRQELKLGEVILDISPYNGVNTKNGTPRTIKFPAKLMKELYKYINSRRYKRREDKFFNGQTRPNEQPYLFMKSTGNKYNNNSLNCRWSEIRETIRKGHGVEFFHKQHNLRSTFAINKLKALLNAGYKHGDALSKLQDEMGHMDTNTTKSYLDQATLAKSAHHVSELVSEHLFNTYNEDFELEV